MKKAGTQMKQGGLEYLAEACDGDINGGEVE